MLTLIFDKLLLTQLYRACSHFPPENVITEFCSVSLRETFGVNLHEWFCVEFPLGTVGHEAFIPLWGQRNSFNIKINKIILIEVLGRDKKTLSLQDWEWNMHCLIWKYVSALNGLLVVVSVEEEELHVSPGESLPAATCAHPTDCHQARRKQQQVWKL